VLESAGIAPQSSALQSGAIIVRCLVKNASNTTQEGFVVARIGNEFSSIDRCQVRLKPKQLRTVEFPVRIPASNTESKVVVEISMFAIQDGREVLIMDGDEPALRRVTAFRPSKRSVVTALAMGAEPFDGPDWRWSRAQVFGTLECAYASRIDAELPNDCVTFEPKPLPIQQLDWQGIDNVIIAEPRFLRDRVSIDALRSFLSLGGRVWIMLDHIDCDMVEPLLERHQSLDHVDTVEILRCKVDVAKVAISEDDRSSEYEIPMAFKRLRQSGAVVTHSIDGWPAVMVMPIGRGELILTSLACEGMIQPRKAQISSEPLFQTAYELRKWARNLGEMVHEPRATPLLKMSDLTYPIERIGNPVVSRGWVTGILLGFCAVLTGMGLWRCFVGEIPRLGAWYPALALLASAPILIAGFLQRKDIPETLSQFQWMQFDNPIGGTLRESNAVYLSDPRPMELRSERNGFVLPDAKIQSGITTVTHDDFARWRLSNTAWPAGIWRYTTEFSLPEKSMVAHGTWTSDGLELRLPEGLPAPISDPLLSFVAGTPVFGKTGKDGVIAIDGEFPAEGERWTLRSIVDQEQRRRSDIYQSLFDGSDRLRVQTRTLMGWTELFAEGPQWDVPLQRRGVALVSFPVTLQQAPPGTEILVPYPLVTIRNTDDSNSTPIFRDSVGRWISQSSTASSSLLEFNLPEEAIPLRATSIEVDWDVEAPRRQVRLSLIPGDKTEPVELISLEAPSLPWRSVLSEPALLDAVGNGKWILKIEVSNDREPEGNLPWRIRHLRVSVRGVVSPRLHWNEPPTP
jgi:hypothetical protein